VRGRRSVGIDIGGTAIKGVLMEDGKVSQKRSIPSPASSAELLVEAVTDLVSQLEGRGRLPVGVGIASPYLHQTGEMVDPPNLALKGRYPIKKALEGVLERPVVVENDANAAAFGEWALGSGRKSRVMLCLTLGTGVGGGMVIEGELFRGAHGLAAEFGHITVDPAGPLCGCGNRGCLEAMASATALKRIYGQLREGGGQTAETTDPKEIFRLAKEEEPFAQRALEMVGEALGTGLASLINALDPDTVVVGGGLSNAWEILWPSAKGEMEKRLLAPKHRRVEVIPASLGTWGGAMGAACLAART